MKLTFSAAFLALFLATPAFALQEPDKDKPPQQEEPKKEEPKKQEPDRQQPQEKEKQQQDKAQADKAKQTDKQEQQAEKDRAKQAKTTQEHAQQVQRDEHGNVVQGQRDGGGNGGRTIKEADFRAHFGREHAFRVARRDDRRFNYGGYWFVYNDPWPAGWSYSDEVYVDEIDGQYYLIDPVHPGIRLLVIVSD
jgi:flagellar motor protein MotB